MIYCFSSHVLSIDEFAIQAQYAQHLGKFCLFDIEAGKTVNEFGECVNVKRKRVLLRASCGEREQIICELESMGAILAETVEDIKKIEKWTTFYSDRPIALFRDKNSIRQALQKGTYSWMTPSAGLFIKSKRKGFSAIVNGSQLLNKSFWCWEKTVRKNSLADEYIVSEAMNISKDEIGFREVRLFVRNHQIQNMSRMIHTLQHEVEKVFYEKGLEVINRLKAMKFPPNYVLDLAEIETPTIKKIVMIEMNTITSSMCYVNNSIFPLRSNAMKSYGVEYAYDDKIFPEKYDLVSKTGICYEYRNTYPAILIDLANIGTKTPLKRT